MGKKKKKKEKDLKEKKGKEGGEKEKEVLSPENIKKKKVKKFSLSFRRREGGERTLGGGECFSSL